MIDGSGYVILEKDEYKKLVNPDKCYTFMTKTKAKNITYKILKAYNVVCINDQDDRNTDDWCCAHDCPLSLFGMEAVEGLCTRQKYWSK